MVVGAGIAALEFVLALRALAGAAADLTLIAPDVHATLPPLAVAAPFGRGGFGRLPLDRFATEQRVAHRRATVTRVDARARQVHCDAGEPVGYDELVLAPGARRRAVSRDVFTFGLRGTHVSFTDILGGLAQGYAAGLAFLAAPGCTWTLPLYELALMTREHLRRARRDVVPVHLVTTEAAPLELFGPESSQAVVELLTAAGIRLHAAVDATVVGPELIALGDGARLEVARIVALPVLRGPGLAGLPRDRQGFLPVDGHQGTGGRPEIHAIGDAVSGSIKQGGVAADQADRAAADVAARLGVTPGTTSGPAPLRARLLTGTGELLLEAGRPVRRLAPGEALPAWAAAKVAARHLGPYLRDSALVDLPTPA